MTGYSPPLKTATVAGTTLPPPSTLSETRREVVIAFPSKAVVDNSAGSAISATKDAPALAKSKSTEAKNTPTDAESYSAGSATSAENDALALAKSRNTGVKNASTDAESYSACSATSAKKGGTPSSYENLPPKVESLCKLSQSQDASDILDPKLLRFYRRGHRSLWRQTEAC